MIKKVINSIKDVFIPVRSISADINIGREVECAIDDEIVDCKEIDTTPFTGYPAPAYLQDDPWFGPSVVSEFNQDYMVQEAEIKKKEEENRQYWTSEPENIHEVMYKMATKNSPTTIQLDPIGGSENFQGGDNGYGWMSGTGYHG
jgi:hypothetical protein|tara:strand:- start:723 stop:1157 length:435 start_codon:yes stop_codon:yes gene_type:complete